MTTNSITERIRQNRLFVDDWSVFEKLLLASAVLKSGDQNWGSVSKMILNLLKSEKLIEHRRPADWFTPKACNTQYQLLIETYAQDLPRRKKRDRNSTDTSAGTPVEYIVKQLWQLRMDEIDAFSKLKFKEAEELEKLIRDAHHGRLSAREIEAQYERLEARLINEEKLAILKYEEMMRVREEKRKLIEPFPGSVNTSVVYSGGGEDKSSSPTSPLLTSLLQSPSRASTPIMSNLLTNPTLSKLLETPPASGLLQKELCKPTHSVLVPLPTPSPNSIAEIEEIKAVLPDLVGGVSGDKSGEEGEEFDEKWFDPDFLNMGKEELEGTLNAKALLEVLGAAGEEVGMMPGRNDSVDADMPEVLPLDLDGPSELVEEVVLEDAIIQSVEEAMGTEAVRNMAADIKTDPDPRPSETSSKDPKPAQEPVVDCSSSEVKHESKEELVKPILTPVECSENSPRPVLKHPPPPSPALIDTTPSKSKPIEDIKSSNESQPLGSHERQSTDSPAKDVRKSSTDSPTRKVSTDAPAPPLKETRSARASRDVDTREEKATGSDSAEPRERRRSRLAEDPSPVRDRRGQDGGLPPPSPAKETRSGRLLRDELLSSPSKELRSHRGADASPAKEVRTRGTRGSRDSEAASPVLSSPRNSTESPVKETRSRSRDEPIGKLKESPVKEIAKKECPRKQPEASPTRKSLEATNKPHQELTSKLADNLKSAEKSQESSNISQETPSKLETTKTGERRRLRSEPELTLHVHESEDSSEDESCSEMLEEMKRDFRKYSGAASPSSDAQEEFKTPLTSGAGRKRKHGEGRASPFLSDKEAKSQDPRAKKTLLAVYQTILTYKHASVFMKPVLDTQANNYSSIVNVQANLSSIKKRIESGAIRTVAQFQRSVLLVFTNAMIYNSRMDSLYKLAKETMMECNKDLQILVKAVPDSGGVEYNLQFPGPEISLDSSGPSSPYTTERTKRASAPSPSPLGRNSPLVGRKSEGRKSRRGGGEEEEDASQEDGGRRGMKRPAAPTVSPKPVLGKKRRMK